MKVKRMAEGVAFADTYALIAMLKDKPAYERYKGWTLIGSAHNLMELCYYLLRIGNEELAEQVLADTPFVMAPISETSIGAGARYKFERRQDRLSYADCLGYALARELGIPFLTGDVKFKDVPGVLFVAEA